MIPVPLKFTQDLHNPCCRLVVVLLPSPVTAIDPAVLTPVNVLILSVDAIMLNLLIQNATATLTSVTLGLTSKRSFYIDSNYYLDSVCISKM